MGRQQGVASKGAHGGGGGVGKGGSGGCAMSRATISSTKNRCALHLAISRGQPIKRGTKINEGPE